MNPGVLLRLASAEMKTTERVLPWRAVALDREAGATLFIREASG